MKFFLFVILYACLPVSAQLSEKIAKAAEAILGENIGDRFFYYPTSKGPHDPADYGFENEAVTLPSEDQTKLHGWFLPAKGVEKAKGWWFFRMGTPGRLRIILDSSPDLFWS